MRLDKYLADMSIGSRSQVKDFIKKGLVSVNDQIIKKSDLKINDDDVVCFDGKKISYVEYEYYLLNKPAGYLSATEDRYDPVVMELIHSQRKDLSPIGRLDKDSEGLLLISNDGELNHRLLSPKYHVPKKYYVEVDTDIPENAKEILENPIDLGDFISKPGVYENIDKRKAYLTISEGKFHQVKRMFEKLGCTVTYLKRVSFGPLILGELKTGEYRKLNEEEINLLQEYKNQ